MISFAEPNCADSSTYEGLNQCLTSPDALSNSDWVGCENYAYDRSLRPNVTNSVYDKGEPWETAVTQFDLVCENDWMNALIISMGLAGQFVGALISAFYVDRFGRKNAILVWLGIQCAVLVSHTFMPNAIGFLITRVLAQVTSVR